MENNEVMVTELTEQEIGTIGDYDDYDCTGGRKGNFVVGTAIALGAAALCGFAYHKCKDKLEERKINRLRNKGYVIFKEEDCEVRVMEETEVEELETETEK